MAGRLNPSAHREQTRTRIIELHGKGLTTTQIRQRLGVSATTVQRALKPGAAERFNRLQQEHEARKRADSPESTNNG